MDNPDSGVDDQKPKPRGGATGSAQGGLGPGLDLLVDEHEEEESVDGRTVRQRGIYLLPNLFTPAHCLPGSTRSLPPCEVISKQRL